MFLTLAQSSLIELLEPFSPIIFGKTNKRARKQANTRDSGGRTEL